MMNSSHRLILASNSPRRQALLKAVGFEFTVRTKEVDETFPPEIPAAEVALFLAGKKAEAYLQDLGNEVIITADTIVKLGNQIMGKPADYKEAFSMLKRLSGKSHEVITGVCITGKDKAVKLDDITRVYFRNLTPEDIDFYITHYSPFDKAGAYGIQECLPENVNLCSPEEIRFINTIDKPELFEETKNKQSGKGVTAIEKIEGSYFNVVGLPIHKVYEALIGL